MSPVLEREVKNRKRKIVQAMLSWGKENIRPFPWRVDRTPYKVLVAEVILRRTTAKAASKVYEEFIKRYPDINVLAQANLKDLEDILKKVGYHKRRALILIEIARAILSDYDGVIPDKKEELIRIPHIGHYIAGAVLSLGYGIPSPMVDTNVQRVIERVFAKALPTKKKEEAVMKVAEAILPTQEHELFNFAMLDLGALICRYNKKLCQKCPLQDVCDSAT